MARSPRPPRTVVAAAWLLLGYGVLSLLRLWWFGAGLPGSVTQNPGQSALNVDQ